jgi:protein-arginine kinase activator protein McsA
MLCEICQERQATVHTGSESKGTFSRHFCEECFQEKGPLGKLKITHGVEQACHYCGQPCHFGTSAVSVEMPGAVACCRECAKDFDDYVRQHMGEHASEEEFARHLEVFIKKRIVERESEQ